MHGKRSLCEFVGGLFLVFKSVWSCISLERSFTELMWGERSPLFKPPDISLSNQKFLSPFLQNLERMFFMLHRFGEEDKVSFEKILQSEHLKLNRKPTFYWCQKNGFQKMWLDYAAIVPKSVKSIWRLSEGCSQPPRHLEVVSSHNRAV